MFYSILIPVGIYFTPTEQSKEDWEAGGILDADLQWWKVDVSRWISRHLHPACGSAKGWQTPPRALQHFWFKMGQRFLHASIWPVQRSSSD